MCGNYSREETIQGRKLYEEIRYTTLWNLAVQFWVNFITKKLKSKHLSQFLWWEENLRGLRGFIFQKVQAWVMWVSQIHRKIRPLHGEGIRSEIALTDTGVIWVSPDPHVFWLHFWNMKIFIWTLVRYVLYHISKGLEYEVQYLHPQFFSYPLALVQPDKIYPPKHGRLCSVMLTVKRIEAKNQ